MVCFNGTSVEFDGVALWNTGNLHEYQGRAMLQKGQTEQEC